MAQWVEHIIHIMGQTKEASPRWGVPKASDLSLLARKEVEVPLQGASTPFERTERGFESNCHHHKHCRITLARFFLCPESAVFDLPPKKVAPSKHEH